MSTLTWVDTCLAEAQGPFPWRHWLEHPEVLEYAKRMAEKPHPGDARTVAERYEDYKRGNALERAIFEFLLCLADLENALGTAGPFTVERAETWVYDLTVKQAGHEPLCIDVKGRFKPNATTYSQRQTEAEALKGPYQHLTVIYLCFDCRGDEEAVYEGWCYPTQFKVSNYKDLYIFPDELNGLKNKRLKRLKPTRARGG